jgi:hypothetical protein
MQNYSSVKAMTPASYMKGITSGREAGKVSRLLGQKDAHHRLKSA